MESRKRNLPGWTVFPQPGRRADGQDLVAGIRAGESGPGGRIVGETSIEHVANGALRGFAVRTVLAVQHAPCVRIAPVETVQLLPRLRQRPLKRQCYNVFVL